MRFSFISSIFPRFFQTNFATKISNQPSQQTNSNGLKFKKIRNGALDFEIAPVYSTILLAIIIINLGIFLVGIFQVAFLKKISDKLLIYLAAHNKPAILHGYQFWRFFTFPLVENVKGLNVIVAGLIIFLTFYRIGYYTELTLGSRKTALLWISGILTIGILQFGLAKHERLYFYGTSYLTLLSIGALFCYYFMQFSRSEQVNQKIRSLLWQTTLITVFAVIVRYVERNNFIFFNQSVPLTTDFRSWVVIAPLVTFSWGFFLILFLLRTRVNSQFFFWFAPLFCCAILAIAITMTVFVYLNEYNLNQNNFWSETLHPQFWEKYY